MVFVWGDRGELFFQMSERAQWEWIFAYGLFLTGTVPFHYLRNETHLNFGESLMKNCKRCGKKYYAACIDCSFRNGGAITEDRDTNTDLLHQFHMNMHRDYLENALQWMRIPLNV